MRVVFLLPVSLLAGFVAGYALYSGEDARSPVAAAPAINENAMKIAPVGSDDDLSASTDAKVERLIHAALSNDTGLERDNELYLAIQSLTAADFRGLGADLGALQQMGEKLSLLDWTARNALIEPIVSRLWDVDPAFVPAMAGVILKAMPSLNGLRANILSELAGHRPEELLSMLSGAMSDADRKELTSSALFALAAKDPAKAQAWLDQCRDPVVKESAERAFRRGVLKHDPLRVVEIASSVKDRSEGQELLAIAGLDAAARGRGVLRQLATTEMPTWMLSNLMRRLAEVDPELGVELTIKAVADSSSERLMVRGAFFCLASDDPAKAIARIDELTGDARTEAIRGIAGAWTQCDPKAALTWLMQLPASQRIGLGSDHLLVAFTDWADSDKQAARAWAAALPDGEMRTAAQGQLARSLAAQGDTAEAVQILAGLGKSADPRLLSELATTWATRDPQAAADWAIAQPPGQPQSRALAGVVSAWTNENPAAVARWLEQFPSGETRDRCIAAFLQQQASLSRLSAKDAGEFDRWFERIDDPWRRAHAAASQFRVRERADPQNARVWLNSLSNVDRSVLSVLLSDVAP